MSNAAMGGLHSYQMLDNSLQGPLLILNMLYNITSNTKLKDKKMALQHIEYLQNYARNLYKSQSAQISKDGTECEKCQLNLEQTAEEIENLKMSKFVLDAITKDDKEGCILRQMVVNKNRVAVEALLTEQVNINGSCNGSSILHAAAATNDAYIIELVLNKGADVRKKDSDGLIPAERAAMEGHDKAVYYLAGREIPKSFGIMKNKLSHLAAKGGHLSVLQTLAHKLRKNVAQELNRFKETPLMLAAANGHLDAVKLLKNMGADPNAEDRNGDTALHKAVQGKHNDVVDYLLSLKNAPINKPNKSGNTPLFLALLNGQEDLTSKLIDAHADWSMKGQSGNTVLHYAALSNMVNFMRRLLPAMDINVLNENNNTPLHMAASANSIEAARVLLDNGASVNAKNSNWETPLHLAAKNNAKKVTEELLKRGANRLFRDKFNNTPLNLAEHYNNFETAFILK